jgi:hypothetical protein
MIVMSRSSINSCCRRTAAAPGTFGAIAVTIDDDEIDNNTNNSKSLTTDPVDSTHMTSPIETRTRTTTRRRSATLSTHRSTSRCHPRRGGLIRNNHSYILSFNNNNNVVVVVTSIVFMLMLATCSYAQQQQQDPLTMNGGSLLAMAGKQCVALAVDKRFGSGPQVRLLGFGCVGVWVCGCKYAG